jgi:hypothetical protein
LVRVQKRRTTKASKNEPSTSVVEKGASTGAAVEFVNFTLDDSREILAGVARSGAAKTKARRQKEALEKVRKLSAAALRAVRAVGGDVGSLIEQDLFFVSDCVESYESDLW